MRPEPGQTWKWNSTLEEALLGAVPVHSVTIIDVEWDTILRSEMVYYRRDQRRLGMDLPNFMSSYVLAGPEDDKTVFDWLLSEE